MKQKTIITTPDATPDDFLLLAQNMDTYEVCGYSETEGYTEVDEIPEGFSQRVLPPRYGDYLTIKQIEEGLWLENGGMENVTGMSEALIMLGATPSEPIASAQRVQAHNDMVFTEGAKTAQASTAIPLATVGVFADGFEPWQAGKKYEKQYSLFSYAGKVGYTRQANITAQAHQPPFSTGMESVYGLRVVPDENGIYPYERNMAASEGMKVSEGLRVFECTRDIDPLLYPPSQVAAHFKELTK